MAGAGAVPFVNEKLRQRTVILFSKSYSPECNLIKKFISEHNLPESEYEVVEIERRQDCVQIENYFQIICLSDSRAVPQLFIKGKYIGGEKEITLLQKSGDLKKLFVEAQLIS